jgi:hypothetical protein
MHMGLDMTVYTTNEALASEVDFNVKQVEELHFWRKHPNLHGWMERLYIAKGGRFTTFNCTNLALTEHDLDALERTVRNNTLPHTKGFFFGESDGSEKEGDLVFIAKARTSTTAGQRVFYRPWW